MRANIVGVLANIGTCEEGQGRWTCLLSLFAILPYENVKSGGQDLDIEEGFPGQRTRRREFKLSSHRDPLQPSTLVTHSWLDGK
jgi:hypothetical protein